MVMLNFNRNERTLYDKVYRTAVVILAAMVTVTIMEFSPASFGGYKKEALAALRQDFSDNGEISAMQPLPAADINESKETISDRVTEKNRLMLRQKPASSIREKKAASAQIDISLTDQEIPCDKEDYALSEEDYVFQEKEHSSNKEEHSYSEKDYQVLLKIVQAEAGDCDNIGKILVANVVLNRVKNGKFPDTITEVVYEKAQFSPVLDGSINRVEVSSSTTDCVNRALKGEDYSQGALYFMNRRSSRSGNVSWFDQKLTYLFQHEAHEFFK